MDEPVFLSREKVLELHRISLQLHGGLDGLREPGLLDSALMQPEAAYFYGQGDLAAIAAAYPPAAVPEATKACEGRGSFRMGHSAA
jgi:death-on-curing protein